MMNNTIRSKIDLIAYIMESLGGHMIDVELDYRDVVRSIDESVEYFCLNHPLGFRRDVITVTLCPGQKEYPIPDDVIAIMEMTKTLQRNSHLNTHWQSQSGYWGEQDITSAIPMPGSANSAFVGPSYVQGQWRSTHEAVLSSGHQFEYNRSVGRLIIINDIRREEQVALVVNRAYDPEVYPKLYSERWLRDYATMRAKRHLGIVLGKNSAPLIGGGEVNGHRMKTEAEAELQKLREEIGALNIVMLMNNA